MSHLAFAIDGLTDIWDLESPQEVDVELARAMFAALGADVLIYRINEVQGGYFGVARLSAIYASGAQRRADVVFDEIRMFTVELPYASGITMLTRLQFLDDDEFSAIAAQGRPAGASSELAQRASRQEPYSTMPTRDRPTPASERTEEVCAFTGQFLPDEFEWTVISPRRTASGVAHNVLALSSPAREAFLSGSFSARSDLSILADMGKMPISLAHDVNPTGRLIVPDNPVFRPGSHNLADHRRFVFRGA